MKELKEREIYVEPVNSGVKDSNGHYICVGDVLLEEHLINGEVTDTAYCTVGFNAGFVLDFGKLGVYDLRKRQAYREERNGVVFERTQTIIE